MSTVQLPCRAKDWWLDKAIYTRLALSSSPSQWHKKARRLFSTRDENWRIRKNVILLSCHEKDLKKCRNVFPLFPPSSGHLGRSQSDSNSLHSEIFTWFKWLPSLIFSIYTSLPSEKEKKINIPTYSSVSQDEPMKEDISLFRAWKIYLFKYILFKMT